MTSKLKTAIDPEGIGVKVTEMKRTKTGVISMIVGRSESGALEAARLKVAVEGVLDLDAGVCLRTSIARLEIHGISEYDNDCDVEEGLIRESFPLDQLFVK